LYYIYDLSLIIVGASSRKSKRKNTVGRGRKEMNTLSYCSTHKVKTSKVPELIFSLYYEIGVTFSLKKSSQERNESREQRAEDRSSKVHISTACSSMQKQQQQQLYVHDPPTLCSALLP
jgi:hypothetical protein